MKDPKILEKKEQLLKLVQSFCNEYLDPELEQLSIKMVEKLGRKRTVPFLTGKLEGWAAGVIHALCTINFLFDKSSQSYITVHDITGFFGIGQSTASQKSKAIRDMLKLGYFDHEFSTENMKKDNPFNDLISINGFIVPKNMLK